jgi:23S rRNA (cytosine1962-C5)-methyltransferase
MKAMEKESFDAIALDPPSFIPSKKNVAQGIRAYYANNREAVRLLKPGGILSSSTCSFHCEEQGFYEVVAGAVIDAGRIPQILEHGGPAWDHPVLGQMPESRYLNNVLLRG